MNFFKKEIKNYNFLDCIISGGLASVLMAAPFGILIFIGWVNDKLNGNANR